MAVDDGVGWCKMVQDGARWCKIFAWTENYIHKTENVQEDPRIRVSATHSDSQSVSLALLAGALSADASGATPFGFFSSASALMLSIIIGFQRIGSGMVERQGPIAIQKTCFIMVSSATNRSKVA